jgi:hypothetical protein
LASKEGLSVKQIRHILSAAVLLTFLLLPAPAALAATNISLEYRYWTGFYSPVAGSIHITSPEHPWGVSFWGTWGLDDDHCASRGHCFRNSFWGADVTYRLTDRFLLYGGWQELSRYDHRLWMSHTGLRVGARYTHPFSARISGIIDVAYAPPAFNTFERGPLGQQATVVGPTEGVTYRLAVRYQLSPAVALEAGQWNWGFNLPAGRGCCGSFKDHIWLGWYFATVMSFPLQ